jgi:hypothetical protein
MVRTLENWGSFLTENQLMLLAFKYKRTTEGPSNKKYADMLRRALKMGRIDRVEAKIKGNRSTYFYFVPRSYTNAGEKYYTAEDIKEYLKFKKSNQN